MNELSQFGLSINDINYIKNHYNEGIISSVMYKIDNLTKVANYFNSKNLNVKKLLITRLEVFLIDLDIIVDKLSKYESNNIFEMLNEDFSIFDNLN